MMDFDGREITEWMTRCSTDKLLLLDGCEYSDSNDIWVVVSANTTGLVIHKDGQSQEITPPLAFFTDGVFSLPAALGTLLRQDVEGLLSDAERSHLAAADIVRGKGFSISDLGGFSAVAFLADLISAFDSKNVVPDSTQWQRLHEILADASVPAKRAGVVLVHQWLSEAERQNDGQFDLSRRVLPAYLYRHTGQFDKAISVSDAVDFPKSQTRGGSAGLAVLCTTRAASLMDLAEIRQERRLELLSQARLALNKANAVGEGDSDEIRNAYIRLKKMDTQ